MAEKKPGDYKFSNPQSLSINSSDTNISNVSEWLTQDELNIYYTQYNDSSYTCTLFRAKKDSINQKFSTPIKVKLIGKKIRNINSPSLTQDSLNLYISNYLDSNEIMLQSIYIFYKTALNEYTLIDSLKIPNNFSPWDGTLTSDGLKYLIAFYDKDLLRYSRIYVYKRFFIRKI